MSNEIKMLDLNDGQSPVTLKEFLEVNSDALTGDDFLNVNALAVGESTHLECSHMGQSVVTRVK